MASSPVSSLSSFSSGDFEHPLPVVDFDGLGADSSDSDSPLQDESNGRTSKRRRITKAATAVSHYDSPELVPAIEHAEDWTDVSSDTTGSVPGSPRTLKELAMPDEESLGTEQVRFCNWDGCHVGDLGNVDELVAHLNDEHVGIAKKTKFTCEWSDCKAKGKTQMSAYALKAHLRSHTKEKPFYCMLPECDRSFTRSDALAKHMRTVHETESLRTIEHYGRYGHPTIPTNGADATPRGTPPHASASAVSTTVAPAKAPPRLKLVLSGNRISSPSHPQTSNNDHEPDNAAPTSPLSPNTRDTLFGVLPHDLDFPEDEIALPRSELFQLLRRQIHWANQESVALQNEAVELEKERKREWMGRELLLENTLEAEFARTDRRGIIDDLAERGTDAGMPIEMVSAQGSAVVIDQQNRARRNEGARIVAAMSEDAALASNLPMSGQKMPWYRDPQWKRETEAKARMLEEAKSLALREWASDGPSRIEIEDDMEMGGDDTEVEEEA